MKFYTIGHSNDCLEYFLELIRKNGIDTVVDVRRIPYSRYAKQFIKKALTAFLKNQGINYIYMGDNLGGKLTDPQYLTANGRVDLFQSDEKRKVPRRNCPSLKRYSKRFYHHPPLRRERSPKMSSFFPDLPIPGPKGLRNPPHHGRQSH